jgi:fluoride ion exporter CrcB/FEX
VTTTQFEQEASSMATSAAQVTGLVRASSKVQQVSRIPEKTVLKVGAIAGGIGLVLQLIMEHLHPHHAQPNNSVAAFTEYAHATGWTAVHIGQFFGTLLIAVALLALCRSLTRQPGLAGAFASGGAVALVVVASVFAVQMAVDGVALKHAVDTWAGATDAAKTSAFQVAEGVRWLEKGLSAFFHFMNGTALLGIGLSIVVGRSYRSWSGWVAIAAGIGFLAGGALTASSGFSMDAATILQPSLLLLAVFLVGSYVSVWRRGMRSLRDEA